MYDLPGFKIDVLALLVCTTCHIFSCKFVSVSLFIGRFDSSCDFKKNLPN